MSPDGFEVSDDADDLLNHGGDLLVTAGRTRRRVRTTSTRRRAEAAIQDGCQREIKLRGYSIVTTGGRFLVTGTPDILGCVEGRFLALEVKRPGEKPTPAQLGQLRRWQAAGALAAWVDDEAQVAHVLEHLHDRAWRNDFERPGDGR